MLLDGAYLVHKNQLLRKNYRLRLPCVAVCCLSFAYKSSSQREGRRDRFAGI